MEASRVLPVREVCFETGSLQGLAWMRLKALPAMSASMEQADFAAYSSVGLTVPVPKLPGLQTAE